MSAIKGSPTGKVNLIPASVIEAVHSAVNSLHYLSFQSSGRFGMTIADTGLQQGMECFGESKNKTWGSKPTT
jgi:hypothetical protein